MTIALTLPGNGKNHESITCSIGPAGAIATKGHTVPREDLRAKEAARTTEVRFVMHMASRQGWGPLVRKGIHDGAILMTFKSGAIATIKL